jgi:spore coat protein YsxE
VNDQYRLKKAMQILKNYQIDPYFIEKVGKVEKIYSKQGIFALKKIDPHLGIDFIRHVQNLYQKGFNRIVPIYPTMDGRYAVLHHQELYYLMPWLPNEGKDNHFDRNQQLFRELARLHMISAKEIKINKEERTEHYEKTLEELDREKEFLETSIESCERKTYMSPFELMFCLYYHDISQALTFSQNKLKAWYEETQDDSKARMVIVHGKVSSEHFVYDEKGYGHFINFEGARLASPAHDLLPYLNRSLRSFPKRSEETIDWLYTYFKYFPLKEEEMNLFLSYFSHPSSLLKSVERFFNEGNKRNERKAVQKLQREYWLLKNTEYIIMRIDEIERVKKQQSQQAQQQKEPQN